MPTGQFFCGKCGAALTASNNFCTSCGAAVATGPSGSGVLPPPPSVQPPPAYYGGHQPPPAPAEDSALANVFPYKNGKALAAYYFGCFSFVIPLLAIPAVVFGILGWNAYRSEPRLKGATHAWIGIIAALVACLLWAMLVFSWSDTGLF